MGSGGWKTHKIRFLKPLLLHLSVDFIQQKPDVWARFNISSLLHQNSSNGCIVNFGGEGIKKKNRLNFWVHVKKGDRSGALVALESLQKINGDATKQNQVNTFRAKRIEGISCRTIGGDKKGSRADEQTAITRGIWQVASEQIIRLNQQEGKGNRRKWK